MHTPTRAATAAHPYRDRSVADERATLAALAIVGLAAFVAVVMVMLAIVAVVAR